MVATPEMSDRTLELALRMRADMAQAIAEFDKAIDRQQKHQAAADAAGKAAKREGQDIDKATSSVKRHGDATAKTTKQTDALASSIKRATAAAAGYLTLRTALRLVAEADAWRLLQARVRNATRETGDYVRVSRELYSTSQRNGTALESTVSLFQSISRSGKELNATNSEILKFTDLVQKSGRISGASQSAQANGLLQLGQGLAAGVLRAEEMNSVLENIPDVAQRIADGLGLSVGQLRLAVVDGKILSKDVFKAILSQADQINREVAEMPRTLEQAGQAAANSFQRMVGAMNEAYGLSRLIGKSLEGWGLVAERIAQHYEDQNSGRTELRKVEESLNELFTKRLRLQEQMSRLQSESRKNGDGAIIDASLLSDFENKIQYVDDLMQTLFRRRKELLKPFTGSGGSAAASGDDPLANTLAGGNKQFADEIKKRESLYKDLQRLNDEITNNAIGTNSRSPSASVLGLSRKGALVRNALDAGDIKAALKGIEEGKQLIESLRGAKGISDQYLSQRTQELLQLTEAANKAEIKPKIDPQQITEQAQRGFEALKAAFLKQNETGDITVPITIGKDGVVREAKDVATLLQQQMTSNPLVWPVRVVPQIQAPGVQGQPLALTVGSTTVNTLITDGKGPELVDALRVANMKTGGGF